MMAGPLMTGINAYKEGVKFREDREEKKLRMGILTEQEAAARRAGAAAEKTSQLQNEVDNAVKEMNQPGGMERWFDAALRFEAHKNPAQAYKWKNEVTAEDAERAAAKMMGLRAGIQAGDPNAFKELAEVSNLSPEGMQLVPEKSFFNKDKNEGALAFIDPKTGESRQAPVSGKMLDAMIVQQFRKPSQFLDFAKTEKERAQALRAQQEIDLGVVAAGVARDVAATGASNAAAERSRSETAENEDFRRLGGVQARIRQLNAAAAASVASAGASHASKEAAASAKQLDVLQRATGMLSADKFLASWEKAVAAVAWNPSEVAKVNKRFEALKEVEEKKGERVIGAHDLIQRNPGLTPSEALETFDTMSLLRNNSKLEETQFADKKGKYLLIGKKKIYIQ